MERRHDHSEFHVELHTYLLSAEPKSRLKLEAVTVVWSTVTSAQASRSRVVEAAATRNSNELLRLMSVSHVLHRRLHELVARSGKLSVLRSVEGRHTVTGSP